jgi:hypothetical protein
MLAFNFSVIVVRKWANPSNRCSIFKTRNIYSR